MKRPVLSLAATILAATTLLAGCGDDEPTTVDDPATSEAAAATPESSSEPTAATTSPDDEVATHESSEGGGQTVDAAVFFLGETPSGLRLFSEIRAVESDNPPAAALALVVAGDATDPDYRSLVPPGSIGGDLSFDGLGDDGSFAVELTDQQWTQRPAGMSRAEARLAVQQIVYTLLTAAGEGDAKGRTGTITFQIDGQEVSFLGVPSGVKAAKELLVRALVNVTTPAEGATVSGSFTAEGMASSFEATVPWEIRDQGGRKVLDGFTTATGWIGRLYPWTAEVDLGGVAPGEYTFVAMTDDPSGGEGRGPTEDTRSIVVE